MTMIKQFGKKFVDHLGIHLYYPFSKVITLPHLLGFPIHFAYLIWYLSAAYNIAIEFELPIVLHILKNNRNDGVYSVAFAHFFTMLSWYQPLNDWIV